MVNAGKKDHRIGEYRLTYQVLIRRRVSKNIQVVKIGRKAIKQAAPIVNLQRNLYAFVALNERGQHVRSKIFSGGPDSQTQSTGVQSAQVFEVVLHVFDRAEDDQASLVKKVAGFGAVNALADLLEKRQADSFAEFSNLGRDSGLCHVQFFGSTSKAA